MERQYIGARYVPIFADPIEWNDQRTYEPLTIVTYLGASYTSKKRVPAGIQPTNADYWVVTGNYNAQVEEYRQEVVGVKEDIDWLNEKYNKRWGRKWLFIGDSYDVTSHWIGITTGLLGLKTGDYWNLAVSGHGFCNGSWLNDVKTWVNANPNEVKNIGHIVIGGGLNDSVQGSSDTLWDAMVEFGEYCAQTFDEAIVQLAYFGWQIDNKHGHSSTPQYRANSQWLYSQACGAKMQYLCGCECAIHARSLMLDDGAHPNDQGGKHIALAMCNAIKNGSASTNFPINICQFTPKSGTPYGEIRQSLFNGAVYTHFALVLRGMNTTFVGGTDTEIGDLILTHSNSVPLQDLVILVKKTDNTYVNTHFHVTVANDKVLLNYQGLSEDNTNYGSINVDTVNIFFDSCHSAMTD